MKKNQQGLSLVELLIAMALGLVLMGGVIHVFLSSRMVFSTQQAISRVQESGRLAMEFIAEDTRMAGYMGCLDRTIQPEIAITTPDAFWENFEEPVRGYPSGDLPVGLNLNPAPVDGSDTLVIRSARGAMHYLSEKNITNSLKIFPGTNQGITIKAGEPVVVSNCVSARIFKPATVSAGGAGSASTITHGGGWGEGNSPSENFDVGAEMIPVSTTIYYIANNPANRPALYQKIGTSPAVEIIEGVESMALTFGLDTTGDDVVDSYKTTASMAAVDWPKASSVRVELLVQSNEANVLEDAQSYHFRDAMQDAPEDRRLRQVFSSLIAVRGRVN